MARWLAWLAAVAWWLKKRLNDCGQFIAVEILPVVASLLAGALVLGSCELFRFLLA